MDEGKYLATAKTRLLRNFNEDQAGLLSLFMLSQSKHETDNFTSNVFKKNNNVAGYKDTSVSIWQQHPQPDTAVKAYGYYVDPMDCVNEIADWLGRRKQDFAGVKTVSDYASKLKDNSYYEDSVENYTKRMTFYFKSLGNDVISAVNDVVSGKGFDMAKLKPVVIVVLAFIGLNCLKKLVS
jgi:hypothetical protein